MYFAKIPQDFLLDDPTSHRRDDNASNANDVYYCTPKSDKEKCTKIGSKCFCYDPEAIMSVLLKVVVPLIGVMVILKLLKVFK